MTAIHLHLDPVGGVAGDMFAAAMLDAFPELRTGLDEALRTAGLASDVRVRCEPVRDEVLAGMRFIVDDPRERLASRPAHHSVVLRGHDPNHAHVPWAEIRGQLERCGLDAGVRARALDIFGHLARAEAAVHGFQTEDDVIFHEVGAQDSVADVVAAAWLIEGARCSSWSCGAVPLGAGTVHTAHGALPIPAPATARLLEGLSVHDDGRPGERVTPTGAAILRHLASEPGWRGTRRPIARLGGSGVGWGTKRFIGLPNILRVTRLLVDGIDMGARLNTMHIGFEASADGGHDVVRQDVVSQLAFEVDDQSPEDLAAGLDHLRAHGGVFDVLQAPGFGKKGRMVMQVRVLCAPEVTDDVVRACLFETTTLGVRVAQVHRSILPREATTLEGIPVKRTLRPDGAVTVKAESDAVASIAGAAHRGAQRRRVEKP